MKKALLVICAAVLASSAIADEQIDRAAAYANMERNHREALRTVKHWYRGFMGDGVNRCENVKGDWSPREDMVRNGWTAPYAGTAKIGTQQYAIFYTDRAYTTLVYGNTPEACQAMLDMLVQTKAEETE